MASIRGRWNPRSAAWPAIVVGLITLLVVGGVALGRSGDNSTPSDEALSPLGQAALENAETVAEGGDLPSEGVPASQCPGAVKALTAAGSPPSPQDHIFPDCRAGFAVAEALREADEAEGEARRR